MLFRFPMRWLGHLVLFGVCLWGVSLAPAYAQGPVGPEYFSMDDGGVVSANANVFELARATGAPQLRMSVWWKSLEPVNTTPDNYNWTYLDAYFKTAFDGGLTPLVFIAENPSWASNVPCGPIDTQDAAMRAEFGEFMGALAARYPQIKIWILYNESDGSSVPMQTGGCFGDLVTGDLNSNGVPDYADYAEMAGIARDAVHQGNPDAQLSLAVAFDDFDMRACPPAYGCWPASHFDYNFLPHLFGYMASNPRPNDAPYADWLTFTYYDIYGPYWEREPSGAGVRGIQAKAAAIRQRMNDAGVSFPLFVSETGTNSGLLGYDGQSRCLAVTLVRGMATDLRTVVWWTFMDNASKNWYYGLVDSSANPKPSYEAFRVLFGEMNGWTYQSPWTKNSRVEGYQFLNNGKTKWVLWSNRAQSDGKVPCAYPRSTARVNLVARRVLVTDMYGTSQIIRDNRAGDLNPEKGRIRLKVDGVPKYITLNP